MTEPDIGRIEELFQQAVDLPTEERGAWLAGQCAGHPDLRARVEALLDQYGRDESLRGPYPSETARGGNPEGAGTIIGRYKLLQEIGEGGFGVVYMAEQTEPVTRRVALKLVKLGMDTREVVARFEAERQALAMMDHPNIARVLDGGATEAGRPYFVMELVRGISITDYCDQNELTTSERLELFLPICQAVQHAHQKGVIHRDLKPSNVMVTSQDGKPIPKVIDFGIAKAMHTRLTEKTLFTQYQRFIGTPAYMSPEQAVMSAQDVDTRTDIYSLGVLLYELLTGSTPFDPRRLIENGLAEIQRVIREVEPERPSSRISTTADRQIAVHRGEDLGGLSRKLRGDLDWIVMKALEKERGRRYDTAVELAQDIERHLSHEPVVAGPPTTLYRVRKLIQRKRAAVVTASVIALALVGGTVGTTVGMLEAGRQRDDAVAFQRDAESTLGFLIETLALTDPEIALDKEASVHKLLIATAQRLDEAFGDRPWTEAQLRATIGRAYESLGEMELADPQLRRAAELMQTLDDVDPELHYHTLWAMTHVAFQLERDDAFAIAMRARDVAHAYVRDGFPKAADALDHFAQIVDETARQQEPGMMDEVLRRFEAAVRTTEEEIQHGDPRWPILADTYMGASYNLWYTPHEPRSLPLLEEVLRIQRRELSANHPSIAETMGQLVGILTRMGQPDEAEKRMRESVEYLREVYPADNFHVALAESMLGGNLVEQGRFEAAEPLLVGAHGIILEAIQDPSNFYGLDSFGRMIRLYSRWGREDDAQRYRKQLRQLSIGGRVLLPLSLALEIFGPGEQELAEAFATIHQQCETSAYSCKRGNKTLDALRASVERFFTLWEALEDIDPELEIFMARNLVAWTNALVDDEGGLRSRIARQALGFLENRAQETPYDVAEARAALAVGEFEAGRESEAFAEARRVSELVQKIPAPSSWWDTTQNVRIGRYLVELRWFAEAERLLLPSVDVLARQLGETHSETDEARACLVQLYEGWNKPAEARKYGG